MLIDNKVDRYPEDGLGIKTVWDFISLYSGQQSGQIGKLDIVTGYFTIRALSKLYRELPEQDEELYGNLREKIAMLSKSYRDVMIK